MSQADSVLARFKETPAKTDAEHDELLRALASQYAFDGDSKWARMLEELNARTAEKKSKQWLKRAVGKLEASESSSVAAASVGGEAQPSGRQRKKQEKADSASMQAARRVAADTPEDPDERADFICRKTVEHFWDCLSSGDLPEQEVEGIFGCKMKDVGGEAAYNAWGSLIQRKLVKQEDITNAIVNGKLPTEFRTWLKDLQPKQQTPETLQLLKNPDLMAKIPWDADKLERCAKPSAQVAATLSAAEASKSQPVTEGAPWQSGGDSGDLDLETLAKQVATGGSSPELMQLLAGQLAKGGQGGGKDGGYDNASSQDVPKNVAEMVASQAAAPDVKGGSGDGYSWTQQPDEVEICVDVPAGTTKKDVKMLFKVKELSMEAPSHLKLQLHNAVDPDGCGWTLSKGQVVVTLEKKEVGMWPQLTVAGKK